MTYRRLALILVKASADRGEYRQAAGTSLKVALRQF
jgi:hypothetical protein